MNLTLGQRIKLIRGKEAQEAFAVKIGASRATLSNYERDENQPSADILQEICTKYNVLPEWLLMGTGPMRKDAQEETECECQQTQVLGVELVLTNAGMEARIKILEEELAAAKEGEKAAMAEALRAYKLATEAMRPATDIVQKEVPPPAAQTPQKKQEDETVRPRSK